MQSLELFPAVTAPHPDVDRFVSLAVQSGASPRLAKRSASTKYCPENQNLILRYCICLVYLEHIPKRIPLIKGPNPDLVCSKFKILQL